MRTKALLCAAALAAGIATSMAQSNVYSLNVVGYYNITIPAGKMALIANQLNTTNNTLGSLIPSPVPGSTFYKYATGSGYSAYNFDEFDLVWYPNGNVTLNPGEGGFFLNAAAAAQTITFVGEVMQGCLTNPVPSGYSIRSSMVPQAGGIGTALGYAGVPGDTVYRYSTTGYSAFNFDEFDLVWYPSEPQLNVGESFFMLKPSAAASWGRCFTVQ